MLVNYRHQRNRNTVVMVSGPCRPVAWPPGIGSEDLDRIHRRTFDRFRMSDRRAEDVVHHKDTESAEISGNQSRLAGDRSFLAPTGPVGPIGPDGPTRDLRSPQRHGDRRDLRGSIKTVGGRRRVPGPYRTSPPDAARRTGTRLAFTQETPSGR